MRAVLVGGGIGGTAAAVALARAGIDVRVYESWSAGGDPAALTDRRWIYEHDAWAEAAALTRS